MPCTNYFQLSAKPAERDKFTLKLQFPSGKMVVLPMPEREARLRIQVDADPAFELESGAFHLELNSVCFRSVV